MANRKKDRRSRKRRSTLAANASTAVTEPGADSLGDPPPRKRKAGEASRAGASPRASATKPVAKKARSVNVPEIGEDGRPLPPWHPLPISEVLILVGAIVTVIGARRGLSHSNPTLYAGLVAAGIGVGEFTWREHKGGFRSHTWMLTTLSMMVLDIVVVLGVSAVTQVPKALGVVLPLLDVAVGIVLFKLLRARFIDAHRARVFEGKRSRR